MGMPKALLSYEGETLLDRWIRLMAEHCFPVLVVVGHHRDQICAGSQRASQATFVVNDAPERGQFSSLKCALVELPEGCAGFMFTPVDYPAVQPATVARLAHAFNNTHAPVVAPRFRGRSGHPVCCARALAAEMLAEPDESQARIIIRRYGDRLHYVEVEDPGILMDVDDPEAYTRLLSQ